MIKKEKMTISVNLMDGLTIAPQDELQLLEALSCDLKDAKERTKDFFCAGGLLKDCMRVAGKIDRLTEKLDSCEEYQLSIGEYMYLNDCLNYLEAIKEDVLAIPDSDDYKRGVFSQDEQYEYGKLVDKLNGKFASFWDMPSFKETCESIQSFQNDRLKVISHVRITIEMVFDQLIRQINDVLSKHLDNRLATIENAARLYFKRSIDRETSKLKKQARELIKPWQTKLTMEHWCFMKTTEEKAMKLAVKGKLVAKEDESLGGYKSKERSDMERNGELIDLVADRFPDDQLFVFDDVLDDFGGFSDTLNYRNITFFYKLVLRGNIIRCNLYPELQPKFDAWLKGETERREEKTTSVWEKLQDAGILDKDEMPVTRNIEEKGLLAFLIAEQLHITKVWKFFSEKWHEKPDSLRKGHARKKEKDDYKELRDKYLSIMRK